MTYKVDKARLIDSMNRPIVNGLFLEIDYGDLAVYTLKEYDHTHNGKFYPSLKKLYLAHEDPIEYSFAETYLLGWRHWQRLCDNKAIRKHIDEWREELELKLRSQSFRDMLDLCAKDGGNYQAAKYINDRGWEKRGAGRPSKEDKLKDERIAKAISNEYSADIIRMNRK